MSSYEYSPLPILEQQDVLAGWRQELHAHPELSFKKIVPPVWLREGRERAPIGARGGLADTGVSGDCLRSGGPSTGLGSDMDAPPITEKNMFVHR